MKARGQIAVIAAIAIAVTVAHYLVDPHAGAVHDLLQRLYYLPVILGGLWFGIRGGLITALAISIVYFPHAYHGWHGPQSLFFRMSEITMYHIIGGLTGFLASRIRNVLKAEQHARKEREAAYDRLREKTEELLALEEQLRRSERLAALGRLTAGLAHEIRNPLSSIKTSVEILHEQQEERRAPLAARTGHSIETQQQPGTPLPSEQSRSHEEEPPDLLAILLEETARLDRILTNFLEFARAEVKKDGTEPLVANLAGAVAKTAELLSAQCRKRNVFVQFDPRVLNVDAAIPESQLRQVLLNLFLNSLDAMTEGGEIRVGAAEVDSSSATVRLVVDDTGPGIPSESAARIFDPFYSTKESGTGLGLSIVERILASHDGSITLDTATMPSSRFRIVLPLAPTED